MVTQLKGMLQKKYTFFILSVCLLWIKTYVVYQVEFHLGIDNVMQMLLLIINPVSSAMMFFGIALFYTGKLRNVLIVSIDCLLSFLLYANVVFYRFFNDFITLPVLFQHKNFSELGDSIFALMHWYDSFYFLDTIILFSLVISRVIPRQNKLSTHSLRYLYIIAFVLFLINVLLAEIDRPQLLTRTFDRHYLVKYLGIDNYAIYDLITSTRSNAQRAFANTNDLVDAENFVKANQTAPNPTTFAKAQGMNVIYVSMESLQNFVIGYKVDGKEVTPFLNQLIHDPHTFYFDNFFHQVGQGKTSDAEFMMANGLFPLPQGSVFMQKAQNTYQAAPEILKSKGYTSAAFHGNYKTFWNRDEMYKALGIDRFYDANYYDMSVEHTINYGMKDKPMIKESIPMLRKLPQPFYAKFILLSNHFPFESDPEDRDFPEGHTKDDIVNHYFQTAHYMDEALRSFFTELKKTGLYDHTMIVMYGDHYGIASNHYDGMVQVLGKPITPYINAQLQRVPLFIYVPGVKGGIQHQYGGEVDVRATVLHLLGIQTEHYLSFSSDLLSQDHREIVPFRNGDVITKKYSILSGKCYLNPSGQLVDKQQCQPYSRFGKTELALSDSIIYGDLLRFYQPKDFIPVDKSHINYTYEENKMNGN